MVRGGGKKRSSDARSVKLADKGLVENRKHSRVTVTTRGGGPKGKKRRLLKIPNEKGMCVDLEFRVNKWDDGAHVGTRKPECKKNG